MTMPKHGSRYLGWHGAPDAESNQQFAQWVFLQLVAELVPDVMTDLERAEDDGPAILAWARRWNLERPWVVAHARATWRRWRHFPISGRPWFDRDDVTGALVPDVAAPVPAPLKDPDHLRWFIRFQIRKEPYLRIAKSTDRDVRAVMMACHALAPILDLPLRPTRRGRPPLP